MSLRQPLLVAAAGFALGAAGFGLAPALGQDPASSLRGHDTRAPIDVGADRIEVQDRADRAVLSGNVVVRQAELTLSAPRVTVVYASDGGLQIQRVEATGGVVVRSPSETAHSQYAIYDTGRALVTLIGGVTLRRGGSNVTGGRLMLDLETGRAVMDGGGPAAAGSGLRTGPTGRVTGTFTVPRREADRRN